MRNKIILFVVVFLVAVAAVPASAQRPYRVRHYYGGYGHYGYGRGYGYGYGYGPNTTAMGSALLNKVDLTIWNDSKAPVEIFIGHKRVAKVKPGDNWGKTVKAAGVGTGLLASNWWREDWPKQFMMTVRSNGKRAYKKISIVTPNQSSHSERSITLRVFEDEEGRLVISAVDPSVETVDASGDDE